MWRMLEIDYLDDTNLYLLRVAVCASQWDATISKRQVDYWKALRGNALEMYLGALDKENGAEMSKEKGPMEKLAESRAKSDEKAAKLTKETEKLARENDAKQYGKKK